MLHYLQQVAHHAQKPVRMQPVEQGFHRLIFRAVPAGKVHELQLCIKLHLHAAEKSAAIHVLKHLEPCRIKSVDVMQQICHV